MPETSILFALSCNESVVALVGWVHNVCTFFPAKCRVLFGVLSHFSVVCSVCVGVPVVTGLGAPFPVGAGGSGALFHISACRQCSCAVFVVMEMWAPFLAKCRVLSGVLFHISAVCTVCMGALVVMEMCEPFPAGAGYSGVLLVQGVSCQCWA